MKRDYRRSERGRKRCQGFVNSSGSLAMFTAMRHASSRVSIRRRVTDRAQRAVKFSKTGPLASTARISGRG